MVSNEAEIEFRWSITVGRNEVGKEVRGNRYP
jgi:hypothetical protein